MPSTQTGEKPLAGDGGRDAAGEPHTDTASPSPPVPPDGGYGWVVMFASFACIMIVDGVCFSFGIFYLEFLAHFGASKTKTAWIGSVLNAASLITGPLVSALTRRFGCRAVCVAGSLLSSAAFILSTFSPNTDVLLLTYGILAGTGFGLIFLPAIVMVGFYFTRRRALATGVAASGAGVGSFLFPPICEKLLTLYGWKGATWILAGVVLNGVVMGALFRPLRASPPPRGRGGESDCPEQEQKLLHEPPVHKSVVGITTYSCQSLAHSTTSVHNGHVSNHNGHAYSASVDNIHLRQKIHHSQQLYDKSVCRELERPLSRKDIFYSGSLARLPEYQAAASKQEYVASVTSLPPSAPATKGPCSAVTDMLDFTLLTNPVFCLYGLCCFLCMAGFYIPFIFLPDHALSLGASRDQSAALLSIIGILNTVSRVVVGLVSDQPWADPVKINAAALVMGGVATAMCPLAGTYGLLAAYAAAFGTCIAAFVSLRTIIMVELLGLEHLTTAFGLVTMCQGVSGFVGAPIAGALFDATGDYTYSFYMAGAALTAAGLICVPLRPLARWHGRRQQAAEAAWPEKRV